MHRGHGQFLPGTNCMNSGMKNMERRECLIVFVKVPAEGDVKTRLANAIGPGGAALLYRSFVLDIIGKVRQARFRTFVFFSPADASRVVADWLGTDLTYYPQEGEDLGERMLGAFRTVFPSFARAVLIGGDCPDLPLALIEEAFESLRTHHAVVGPATDGGYYLIGFSTPDVPEAPFRDIDWSTPGVFKSTMAILGSHGVDVHVLPPWSDVDEYEDLKALYERQKELPPGRLSTIDLLRCRFGW